MFELPNPGAEARVLAFSPDGRRLAVWAGGQVFVVDCAAGTARTLWDTPDSGRAEGSGLAFTADGTCVVARHVANGRATIAVHDGETGKVKREFPLHSINDGFVPVPGNATVLVAVHPTEDGATAEFVYWNPLTGERSEPFARHRNVVRQMDISADGRWLAGTFGDVLRVWALYGSKPPARSAYRQPFGDGFAMCLALSADGSFAAAGGFKDAVRLIEMRSGSTHAIGARPHGYGRDIDFHPSRPLLAFSEANGEVAFYDPAARAELKRFAWRAGALTAVRFSPDGLRCAAAGAGKVVVWDVDG